MQLQLDYKGLLTVATTDKQILISNIRDAKWRNMLCLDSFSLKFMHKYPFLLKGVSMFFFKLKLLNKGLSKGILFSVVTLCIQYAINNYIHRLLFTTKWWAKLKNCVRQCHFAQQDNKEDNKLILQLFKQEIDKQLFQASYQI